MIWTSWIYNVYTQGVAYSESGTLDGPWIQEKDPITPPNFGHGMLFQTLDGKWLMSVHSHKDVNGRYIRTPRLFEVDFPEINWWWENHILLESALSFSRGKVITFAFNEKRCVERVGRTAL